MLIPAMPSEVQYTYTGLTVYSVPFPFYGLESIQVQVNNNDVSNQILIDLIYGTDYSVDGELDSTDDNLEAYKYGSVSLTPDGEAKISLGFTIAVHRVTVVEQMYQYNELDNFPAKSHENALGRLAVEVQEVESKLTRALVLDPSSTQKPAEVLLAIVVAKDDAVNAAIASEASAMAAASSATTAASNASDATGYANLAHQWATNPVDVPIVGTIGQYSAYHWAQKAEQIAIGDIPDGTPTTRGLMPIGGLPNQNLQVSPTGTSYTWANPPQTTFASIPETIAGVETNKATMPAGVKAAIDTAIAAQPAPEAFMPNMVIMWYGDSGAVPAGWAICDGTNGTPDMRDRFPVGANSTKIKGTTGGSNKTGLTILTINQIPSHAHSYSIFVLGSGGFNLQPGGDYRSSTVGATTSASGGGQGHDHDNTPPYLALHFIMKL